MDESAAQIDRDEWPYAARYAQLADGRMHYVDEGEGSPIVFAHGTPTWSFEWRHLIEALSPRFRCIAPDMLGFGLSDRPANADYSPEAHSARFREFVDQLDLPRFTLVVHDFGGPVALPVALQNPERIRQLVIINTWMWSFADDRSMQRKAALAGGGFGRFLYRRMNFSLRVLMPSAYGDRRKLTAAIHQQYLDRFPDMWSREAVLWALARSLLQSSDFFDSLWQQRAQLAGIPTLILWGMKDSAFQPQLLERWREAVPHALVSTIAEAGHWPHEEDPDRVTRELSAFLG